jgi:hypothetical protein
MVIHRKKENIVEVKVLCPFLEDILYKIYINDCI